MKIAVILTLCLVSVFSQQAQPAKSTLKVIYDRIEDRTNVSTKPKDITGDMQLLAYFNHGGKTMSQPMQNLGLLIDSYSREWKFLKREQQTLYVLADEERFKFDAPVRDSSISSGYGPIRVTVHERLTFSIAREDLARIVTARKIEMKIGSQTFTLKKDVIQSLREILRAMDYRPKPENRDLP